MSIPAAITPMSALTMNRPPTVSASIVSRKRHGLSPSPATVPGSSAWNRLWISSRKNPPSPPPRRPSTVTSSVNTTISATVATHSHMISAGVPRDMLLSNP